MFRRDFFGRAAAAIGAALGMGRANAVPLPEIPPKLADYLDEQDFPAKVGWRCVCKTKHADGRVRHVLYGRVNDVQVHAIAYALFRVNRHEFMGIESGRLQLVSSCFQVAASGEGRWLVRHVFVEDGEQGGEKPAPFSFHRLLGTNVVSG